MIGAGLAGLRAADLLLCHGFHVTVLEARDRLGGRLHQERLPNGHLIDVGANWIHGTQENPITELARETQTAVGTWNDELMHLFDEDGKLMVMEEAMEYLTIMWNIIEAAFEYSNKHGSTIHSDSTLLDFFKNQIPNRIPETEDNYAEKQRILLQMCEFWGAFVGGPMDKQSLKFFWLEESIGGGL